MNYLTNIFSALSQLANVMLLNGHPNESISGRSYREGWKVMTVINVVFFWQANHCRGAHHKDVEWAKEFAKL
jgi:hypothetical protein